MSETRTTTTGSHIKGKDLGPWGNFKWELFMIKVRYWNWSMDFKKKICRKLFCGKGYHRVIPNDIVVSKSMKKGKGMRCVLKVEWLECLNCGWLFFANAKDKQKYLNYKKREDKMWNRTIKIMLEKKKCKKK